MGWETRQKDLVLILARDMAARLASPMFVVDAVGTLVFFNEAAEALLGGTFADIGEVDVDRWAETFRSVEDDGTPIDRRDLPPDPHYRGKTAVVFVLHGIRANNYTWPQDLHQDITRLDPNVAVVKPTYYYFSALGFALNYRRKRNIRWFLDEYTDVVIRCWHLDPRNDFHFAGHSNGTYMLGECLQHFPSMKFNRVYLAGSVLPRVYDWRRYQGAMQVQRVRSDRSRGDFPVAVLCNALRGLGSRDIGTAGFDGFAGGTEEFAYYDGGHSKPLDRPNPPLVADYIVHGNVTPPQGGPDPSLLRKCEPTRFFQWLSRFAPWGVYLAPLTVVLVACSLAGLLSGGWLWGLVAGVSVVWLFALFETG